MTVADSRLVCRSFSPQPPAPGDLGLSTHAGFLERNVASLADTLDQASHGPTRRRGATA